jgi:cytoskeletal protein CcmA (bactofilin family)
MPDVPEDQSLLPFPRHKRSSRESQEMVSVIGVGMQVVGSIESPGTVKVAGTVLGNVSAGGQVLVARGGRVDGDVQAPEAVLDGEISGSILAGERVEIQASAVIRGDITTPRLMVHEGAVLDVRVTKPTPTIRHQGVA